MRKLDPAATGLLLVLAFAGLVACGAPGEDAPSSEAQRSGADFTPVIARVGDVEITRGYFDYRHANLSPRDKSRYSGDGWEERFLDTLVQETLVTEKAAAEKYDRIREVEWRLDMSRRSILYKAYYDRNFEDDVDIPEEDLRQYYEKNADAYRGLGRVAAQHIMCASKDKIDQAWQELQNGKRFGEVVAEFSEDEETRADGGNLGWFNRGGYVLGLGFNEAFTDHAFELERGEVAPPFLVDDNWHIVKIVNRVDDEMQSFEDVRERIERTLAPAYEREAYEAHVRALRDELGVDYFGAFQRDTRSAEQLYRLAAETGSADARRFYFQQLVDNYPEHERADEALFMIGFISSEEFGDVRAAAGAFRRLQTDYPQSEYQEDAAWMLQNIGQGRAELRGSQAPTDAESASEKLRELRN